MTITEATSTGSNRLDMIAKSIKDKYEKADFADYIVSELSTEKLKDFLDKNIKDWQTKAEEQLGLDPSSDNFALDYVTEAMYNGKLSAGTLLRKLGTYLSTEELNKILADTTYADTEDLEEKIEDILNIDELEECLNRLTEAEISDEDKHDNELLKNIYDKIQNRLNAKLTDEEKAVLDKYNLYLSKNTRGQNSIYIKNSADSDEKYRRYDSNLFRYNTDSVNFADKARKFPDRSVELKTYEDEEREKLGKMSNALSSRKYNQKNIDSAEDTYNKVVDQAKKQYDSTIRYSTDAINSANKTINKLLRKDESLGDDLAKYQKWVDYDMKRYGRISDKTNDLIKNAGLTIIKDQYGDYEVTDYSPITEDLDEIEIKGNGQKIKVKDDEITIKTCDKDTEEVELKDTEEVIAPLDDEEIAEIDDFDEEDFEELSERYLTEVYNNVNSFKLSKASLNKEGKLKLEGIVTFKSGNKRKTAFLFEKKNSLKSGKIKYIGENLDFSNGRKSFILNCSVNNKKLISESLTYNYTVKDNDGQSKRLYGTVRRNK